MVVKDTALHMFGARCNFSFTHCLSMVNLFLSVLICVFFSLRCKVSVGLIIQTKVIVPFHFFKLISFKPTLKHRCGACMAYMRPNSKTLLLRILDIHVDLLRISVTSVGYLEYRLRTCCCCVYIYCVFRVFVPIQDFL